MNEAKHGTALVSGASSGIGAAVAGALASAGLKVVCAARRADRLRELVDRLGPSTVAVHLDVREKESVVGLLDRIPKGWRDIDVLVNCAGHDIGGRERFDKVAMDAWTDTIDTNLLGAMRVTHVVVPGMLARASGHIVNISSVYALEAHAGSSAYCTSKFGMNGFSKAILDDYRTQGVKVTQILPGVVRTEFSDTRWHGNRTKVEEFYARNPVVLDPDDVARAVIFAIGQPPHVTISDLTIVAGR